MRKTRRSLSNYAVGYGRPPTSSQFKPGQSGNPRGRPKGARDASSMARDALERKIDLKVKGGTRRKVTVREAGYRSLAEKAATGDVKSLLCLLSLESKERPSGDDAQTQPLSAKDFELLQGFFDRRRGSAPHHERNDVPERGAGNTERGTK